MNIQIAPPMMTYLKIKVWPAIRFGLYFGALAGLITLFLPNHYISEAKILPAEQRSSAGMGGVGAAAAAAGVSIPGQDSPDAAYIDILGSRRIRTALLNSHFTFKVRAWYFGAEQQREQSLYDFLGKKNIDRAVSALKKHITITRDLKTKLITIVVETESPELSQQVVQRLVFLLDEFVITKSQTRGGTKATFTEKRLIEARQEMDQAEEKFLSFLQGNRNYTVSPDPSVRQKGQRLENELKLRTQLITTLAIGREQALLEEKNDLPILNVLDSGNLPIEKSAPPRSVIVGLTVALAAAGYLGFLNRSRLATLFVLGPADPT